MAKFWTWGVALAALACSGAASAAAPERSVTNSAGMKLVLIPAGGFEMGSHDSLEQIAEAYPLYRGHRIEVLTDDTRHRVRITRPFYMGAHEVTVGQFRRYVVETGNRSEAEADGTGGYGVDLKAKSFPPGRHKEYSWRNPGFPQGDDHPVVNVSWNDAVSFCRWLTRKEGKTYRLPTEAEWEYACRAGTTTRYNFGDDPEQLAANANTFDAASAAAFPEWAKWSIKASDGFPFTAPVGSFRPNAFGLFDMHGNVWEWCSDYYSEDFFKRSPVDDPENTEPGRRHSRRGGGWHVWPLYCRSNYRNYNTPQSRYLNLGLRVVREADAPAATPAPR